MGFCQSGRVTESPYFRLRYWRHQPFPDEIRTVIIASWKRDGRRRYRENDSGGARWIGIASTHAASAAGRLNSKPDEPEPLFANRLTSLKSADDGHSGTCFFFASSVIGHVLAEIRRPPAAQTVCINSILRSVRRAACARGNGFGTVCSATVACHESILPLAGLQNVLHRQRAYGADNTKLYDYIVVWIIANRAKTAPSGHAQRSGAARSCSWPSSKPALIAFRAGDAAVNIQTHLTAGRQSSNPLYVNWEIRHGWLLAGGKAVCGKPRFYLCVALVTADENNKQDQKQSHRVRSRYSQ